MTNTVKPTPQTPAPEVKHDAPAAPVEKADQKQADAPAKA